MLKEIYASLLAIMSVLLIIFITNRFVHFLKSAAAGKMTMVAVFKVMALQIPLLLGYLLPLGLYLSIIIVLGRMYMDHEMAVLNACGVSKSKILAMIMGIAVVVCLFDAWLMIYAEPVIQQFRITTIEHAMAQATVKKIIPKRFTELPDNKGVFYAKSYNRDTGILGDVFFAQQTKPAKKGGPITWDITFAQSAFEKPVAQFGQFIVFQHGSRYSGIPGELDYKTLTFKEYGVKLVNAAIRVRDWPMNVPTRELLTYIKKGNHAAESAFQWRIAMPVSVLILAFMAVPLSYMNPRRGKFFQFIPAILIYLIYGDLLFLCRNWLKHGVMTQLGFWYLHGAMFLLALLIFCQFVGWRQVARTLGLKWRTHAAT